VSRIILDLCGGSGAWASPYEKAGYDVRLVTLPENDVRTYDPPENVHGILAAPPCTEFSLVKSEKLARDFDAGMEIVNACLRIIDKAKPKWWALENPVGHLHRFIGPPKFVFQPWEFGDPWTKKTGIWGNFNVPTKTHAAWDDVEQNYSLYIRKPRKKPNMVWLHKSAYKDIPAYHHLPAPTTDAGFRAMTPQGFSRAFFKENP